MNPFRSQNPHQTRRIAVAGLMILLLACSIALAYGISSPEQVLQAAGVQFTLPTGWNVQTKATEQILTNPKQPNTTIHLIARVTKQPLTKGDQLLELLGNALQNNVTENVRLNPAPRSDQINGVTCWLFHGQAPDPKTGKPIIQFVLITTTDRQHFLIFYLGDTVDKKADLQKRAARDQQLLVHTLADTLSPHPLSPHPHSP